MNKLPEGYDELVGLECKTKNYGPVRIVGVEECEIAGKKKLVVEFLNTGTVKVVNKSQLTKGVVKDDTATKESKAVNIFLPGEELKGVRILERLSSGGVITYYRVKHLSSGKHYTLSQREILRGFVDSEYRIQNDYPHLMSLWD